MNSINTDAFWWVDPSIIYNIDRLSEFVVTQDMTTDEKLNAIVRATILFSIIISMYLSDPKYLLLIGVALGITYFIYVNKPPEKFELAEKNQEQKVHLDVRVPTEDSPFMNPNIFDNPATYQSTEYSGNTTEDNAVKKEIFDKFSAGLYRDTSDIYDKNNGFREFYTVPNNIAGYEEYRKFVYGDKASAKKNSYQSYDNLHQSIKTQK